MKNTLTVIALFLSINLSARSTSNMKALFIYQFTRMIEWPADSRTGMFRIGVLGSFESYKEISDITIGRNVGMQNIEVMNVMSISQLALTNFHILVIGEDFCNTQQINNIAAKLKNKPTLLITNKDNFQHSKACIGFSTENNIYNYFYNPLCIKNKGFICSKEFFMLSKENK